MENHQKELVIFIKSCIKNNNMLPFYRCQPWVNLRVEILTEYKKECLDCKKKGRYKRATEVHHVRTVREYPHLALSKTYRDTGGKDKQNLIPLCNECHKHRHGVRVVASGYSNNERWD